MHQISQIYFVMKLYMFRTVRLSIIRNLFTVHSAMVYGVCHTVCRQLSSRSICSCSKAVYKPVWHIPLLSVQWINFWWWTDELSETCRVSWKNKFVKFGASNWFYYKEICYDARSHERKIYVSYGFLSIFYIVTGQLSDICSTKISFFRDDVVRLFSKHHPEFGK